MGQKEGGWFNRGCKNGHPRLEQRYGGNVWRVQTDLRTAGGGQQRLAWLIVIIKTGRVGGNPPSFSVSLGLDSHRRYVLELALLPSVGGAAVALVY